MLPTFLANMFWGSNQNDEETAGSDGWKEAAVDHTASEEDGEWLLISTQQTPVGLSPAHSNSQDCDGDNESVCSEGSWVITPAPAFQCSSLAPPTEPSHPLEDLLIEHPTMSVYHQSGSNHNLNEQTDAISESTNDHFQSRENSNPQQPDELSRLRNRELVVRQNRQRQQVAAHMHVPLTHDRRASPAACGFKQPQVSRRALKRRNANNVRHGAGKLHQGNRMQKSMFKAGRRRC